MTDFDVTVVWQRPDASTVELPATLCYADDVDDPERRGTVAGEAIANNLVDFPEDLPRGSLPVSVRFADV